MKINDKEFGNIFLAPMAGVSDVGFRTVCKMSGADLTYTEMVSSKALIYNSERTKELLITNEIEIPKAVQIFGHIPSEMAQVCASEDLKKFDIIDINFGCPAPKIVKNGDGSSLLTNLPLLESIVYHCVKATDKPITCKFRIGYKNADNVALDVARICEDNGAKAITIHGRTKEQAYSGGIDYETIAKVKSSVKIPVIGNGNIDNVQSYNTMLSTGVDAVMIGRGSLGDPNIFNRLKGKKENELYPLIETHINTLKQSWDEKFLVPYMRKHFLWYLKNIPNVNDVKREISITRDLDYAMSLIKKAINQNGNNVV